MISACVCFLFARCVCSVCVFAFARSESMRFPQFPLLCSTIVFVIAFARFPS